LSASAARATGVNVTDNANAVVSNAPRRTKRRDSMEDLAFLTDEMKFVRQK
jgi:hypothetical protein